MKRIRLFIVLVSLGLVLGSCAVRKIGTSQVLFSDTTTLKTVDKIPYPTDLGLEIGESLNLPSLQMNITRLNATEALVEHDQRVITQKETTTQFVPTKTKVKDKSKVLDKSQTDSNNKSKKADNMKIKDNHKQVKRSFPWVLLIVAVGLGALLWLARGLVKTRQRC